MDKVDSYEKTDPAYKLGQDSVLLTREPLVIFTIVNVFLMLIAIGVYLGIFFGYLKKDWVDKKHCVAPVGEFAVEPNTNIETPLSLCPDSGADGGKCIYNVPSLTQAIRFCNQKADICSKFVYNEESNQMKIVSLQGRPTQNASENDNTYTRQSNVTFRTKGSSGGSVNPIQDPDTIEENGININPVTVTSSLPESLTTGFLEN